MVWTTTIICRNWNTKLDGVMEHNDIRLGEGRLLTENINTKN